MDKIIYIRKISVDKFLIKLPERKSLRIRNFRVDLLPPNFLRLTPNKSNLIAINLNHILYYIEDDNILSFSSSPASMYIDNDVFIQLKPYLIKMGNRYGNMEIIDIIGKAYDGGYSILHNNIPHSTSYSRKSINSLQHLHKEHFPNHLYIHYGKFEIISKHALRIQFTYMRLKSLTFTNGYRKFTYDLENEDLNDIERAIIAQPFPALFQRFTNMNKFKIYQLCCIFYRWRRAGIMYCPPRPVQWLIYRNFYKKFKILD